MDADLWRVYLVCRYLGERLLETQLSPLFRSHLSITGVGGGGCRERERDEERVGEKTRETEGKGRNRDRR